MSHCPSPQRPVFPPLHRCVRGLSAVESLIVLCLALVLLGGVVPTFEKARERRHLEGVAAQLRTAVAQARSVALTQDRSIRLRVESGPAGSCYVVHTGPVNACSCLSAAAGADAACTSAGRSLHLHSLQRTAPVVVSANVGSLLFEPRLGTVTPTGTISIRSRSGAELRQVVSLMGRVRTCTPNAVPGYPAC